MTPSEHPLSPVEPARMDDSVARAMRQEAVALAYDPQRGPPRVVAKGRGPIAAAIVQRAHEHGVYVHASRELLSLLMTLDLDTHIPVALYRAVAELLAWLHHLDAGTLSVDSPAPTLTLPEPDVS